MPYLGNQLAGSFVSSSFTSQTITGDGSTSYTLDQSVVNGRELLVYINNVKQEEGSGKSYTASGTTITFSEAVQSGDSCYILFFGQTKQTVEPPQGSIRSNMFANDNLTIPKTLTITDGDVVVASGHGIDFSATGNSSETMSNELFDDYEEGTMPLVIADAESGGNSTNASGTFEYTKIGRTVICQVKIDNINTSGMTSGNVLCIRGFPFTHSDLTSFSAVLVNETNLGSNAQPIVAQLNGNTILKLTHLLDNAANGKLQVSEFETTTADIQTTLVYRTAT